MYDTCFNYSPQEMPANAGLNKPLHSMCFINNNKKVKDTAEV